MIHLRNFWIIPGTLLLALMLVMLPLPKEFQPFRPDWLSLVTLYWAMTLPRVFGIGSAWVVGLILDVSQGTLLGQHASGLVIITYAVLYIHQQLRHAPYVQQAFVIAGLLFIKQLLMLWIYGTIDRMPENIWMYFIPSLLSIPLWLWTSILLKDLTKYYRIQ